MLSNFPLGFVDTFLDEKSHAELQSRWNKLKGSHEIDQEWQLAMTRKTRTLLVRLKNFAYFSFAFIRQNIENVVFVAYILIRISKKNFLFLTSGYQNLLFASLTAFY